MNLTQQNIRTIIRFDGATFRRHVNEVTGEIHWLDPDFASGYWVATQDSPWLEIDIHSLTPHELTNYAVPEDIRRYPHQFFLGVWLNPDSNLYQFDTVEHISDLATALERARVNKQISIYDIRNEGTIYV